MHLSLVCKIKSFIEDIHIRNSKLQIQNKQEIAIVSKVILLISISLTKKKIVQLARVVRVVMVS